MARPNDTGPVDPEPQDPFEETHVDEMVERFGQPSGLTCPDCGGGIWEIEQGALVRYRCHVGHQFTVEGFDAQQQSAVEGALWAAVRVLEEHASLRQRMATRTAAAGMAAVASGFSQSADDSRAQAHTIRQLLFSRVEPAAEVEPLKESHPTARFGNGKGRAGNGRAAKVRRRAR